MDRRRLARGGGAALAAAVLSLALVALVAATRGPVAAPWAPATLALVRIGFASALLLAAWGLAEVLAPPSIVSRVGGLCAGLAAALLALSAAAAPFSPPGAQPPWVVWTSYWAPLPLGCWLLCVAAVAWKLDRLPRWLRVVAALDGALLFMQPAVPELGVVALALGLAWWTGLGFALLRLARTDSPAAAEAG
jgi:hypothetical protein